jgi:SAM-dependent methyltransferase
MNDWMIKNMAYEGDIIMYRFDIINYLINKYGYKRYLEIGIGNGETWNHVKAEYKIGLDPNPEVPVTYTITSDEFFSKNNETFDLIFIDGLHLDHQTDKDITNALTRLNPNGSIVLHDCNPPTREHGTEKWLLASWNGTVWKSIVKQRVTNPNIILFVVDIDWGCGIIRKGKQEVYNKAPLETCLTWEYFEINKTEILNLVNTEEFKKRINENISNNTTL